MNLPKIRAYDKLAKQIYYGEIEHFDDMIGYRFEHWEAVSEEEIKEQVEFMMEAFFHDKNGKDAYAGDIVKVAHGYDKPDTDPNHDDATYPEVRGYEYYLLGYNICSWSRLNYGALNFRPLMRRKEYKPYRKKYKPFFYAGMKNMWGIEIVGNKFETPELLNNQTIQ